MDEKKNELTKAREQFEQEKMTRRAALRKFGITTGMSVFGLFAVDDLARMVIGKMQEHEATKQIAEGLAHEFKDAGAVFAVVTPCQTCVNDKQKGRDACNASLDACIRGGGGLPTCEYAWNQCNTGVDETYLECCVSNGCNC